MKIVYIVLLLFVGLWALLVAYLTNYIHISAYFPKGIASLVLPKSTSELGSSLAILDGLFSSIAIVLGLVAIIFQSKELNETTKALSVQMHQQNEANRLTAYTARLQFLLGEMDRLGEDIDRLILSLKDTSDSEKKDDKKKILKNTIEKRKKYRYEAENIDKFLSKQLTKIT